MRSSEGKAQREEQFEQRPAALNFGMLVVCLGKSSLLSREEGIKGLEWRQAMLKEELCGRSAEQW